MFITVQQGEYSINTNQITWIDWTEEEPIVHLACGNEVALYAEDIEPVKKAIGLTK